MSIIVIILSAIAGIAIGGLVATTLKSGVNEKKVKKLVEDAEKEAASLKRQKELEAKEHFMKLKSEHNESVRDTKQELRGKEAELRRKEQSLNDKSVNLDKRMDEVELSKKELKKQQDAVVDKRIGLEKSQKEYIKKLESVASISSEEAKNEMMETIKKEAHTDAIVYVKQIVDEAKLTASKEAKRMILQTIQRTAAEQAIENTVTVFNIESDEVKGRIIGREGRNIRALESATGIELIVDDTPEAIILSGFDPVRREVARLSLHRLISDGRIHPARIEEVVSKTKKELEDEIVEYGQKAVIELGINGLHPQLIRMVGRMRYRSSYGQNLLQHSKEVARLCSTMAAEFGLDAKLAKRGGLLHDIGKVPEEDEEMPHALLGMKLCEKFGENPEVCNSVGAHHDEIEMTSLLSPIVQACDAISGSRPGARREDSEAYLKRLQDLEKTALSFDGVEKAYAIQAGRELRVVVDSDSLDDKKADLLSFDLSQKIMKEMIYPGQIKVTVIRERRAVNFAK